MKNISKTGKRRVALVGVLFVSSVLVVSLLAGDIAMATSAADTDAPYSGDVLVAVNLDEDNLFTYRGSQSTGAIPSQGMESFGAPDYSAQDEETENISDYDDNGIAIIDPGTVLPEVPFTADLPNPNARILPEPIQNVAVGSERDFVVDVSSGATYTAQPFVALYVGEKCVVYTATNEDYIPIDAAEAKILADEFDANYATMTEAFGDPMNATSTVSDPNSDGKVALVCYDIDNDLNIASAYVAGYFFTADILTEEQSSYANGNATDMLHLDSGQGMKYGVDKSFGTMNHEFQHLINYVNIGVYTTVPIILNEAFSEAADHMMYGESTSRIYKFNSDSDIRSGSFSMTNWTSALESYSYAYLFGQYLRTQYGSNDVFNAINERILINHAQLGYADYLAKQFSVMKSAAEVLGVVDSEGKGDVSALIRNFYTALYAKDATGPYGFNGEEWANSINAQMHNAPATLSPGAAVYYTMNESSFTPSGAGVNIQFIGVGAWQAPPDSVTLSIAAHTSMEGAVLVFEDSATSETIEILPGYLVSPSNAQNSGQKYVIPGVPPLTNGTITLKIPGNIDFVINGVTYEQGVDFTANTNANLATIEPLAGDVNEDNRVNFADVALARNAENFNQSNPQTALSDLNGDGTVEAEDIQIIVSDSNYNKTVADSTFGYG